MSSFKLYGVRMSEASHAQQVRYLRRELQYAQNWEGGMSDSIEDTVEQVFDWIRAHLFTVSVAVAKIVRRFLKVWNFDISKLKMRAHIPHRSTRSHRNY